MNAIRSITFLRSAIFGKNGAVWIVLGSLFWSGLPSIGLQSSPVQPLTFQTLTASAQDSVDGSTADEDWSQAWDASVAADSYSLGSGEASPSIEAPNQEGANPSNNPASVQQVPQEFIAAWINDLKQSTDRWIQIDISDQQLTAWEGDRQVYSVTVSTGRPEEPTLAGVFSIQIKQEKAWMQGDTYEIPNVPYTMYYSGNYAIHGTYWHDNFGTPVSNGCINLPVDQAAWLYNWASIGTTVVIEP